MKRISDKKKQEMGELLKNQNLLPVNNNDLFRFMKEKEVFEALLANGADPDYTDSYFKFPILSLAYSHGYYPAFKLLLEYGAHPNVPSTITAEKTDLLFDLFFSYVKNKKYVDVLAKHKVNFNVILPDTGETLLEWMLRYSPLATDAIKTILENGGDPNLPNKDGKTVFDLANNGEIRIIDSLMPLLDQLRK
ncbi:hypothetical protein HYN59_08955 [Flavobacterium album]|uniref:Uncharacterized protein n=1 Tax=Flavobacterium album TaxID=2175091 RepID=A0A2S1QXW5_9FLAO|nr:hypothetical protein [Flavobacterium album]AWH85238.1 hypothetical protein HYN59_08955 [Flavobacterium album]